MDAPVMLGGKFTAGTGIASAAAAVMVDSVVVVPTAGSKMTNAPVVTTRARLSIPKATPNGEILMPGEIEERTKAQRTRDEDVRKDEPWVLSYPAKVFKPDGERDYWRYYQRY